MKNFLIVVLVVAIIVLGYLQFGSKKAVPPTPSGQTTTVNNPGATDYRPPSSQEVGTSVVTTTLKANQYIHAPAWPPIVKTSTSVAYSCTPDKGEISETVQKSINGKSYCVTTSIDAGAGQRSGAYTYTTAYGAGIKTVTFTIGWPNCAGYGGPGDREYNQCTAAQASVFNNLDAFIASLM